MKRSRIVLLIASVLGFLIFLQPAALATGITVFVTVVSPEDDPGGTDIAANDDAGVSWASGVYANNLDTMQKLGIPQATALEVTVIGQTEVGYDRVHLYDAEGAEIRRLSGRIHTRFTVPGSFIWVRFVTDGSVTDQGVLVSVRPAGTN